MIGNPEHAALARADRAEFLFSDYGTSRYVYLIDGVIYKVNRSEGYDANAEEMRNADLMRASLPEGVSIPEMTMYGDVLAMEYIDGEVTGWCTDIELGMECSHIEYGEPCMDPNTCRINGWNDPAWGNAIIEYETGITYLIDVA